MNGRAFACKIILLKLRSLYLVFIAVAIDVDIVRSSNCHNNKEYAKDNSEKSNYIYVPALLLYIVVSIFGFNDNPMQSWQTRLYEITQA